MQQWPDASTCCTSLRRSAAARRRSGCADRAGARRHTARPARGGEGRREASGHDFRRGRRASAPDDGSDSDETVWSDPDDPQFDAYRVSKILAERAAWDFMRSAGGTTQFTTILPGAVFGPILTAENLGSVQIIQGMLKGKPPALPRLGFWIVDVRDLADLHIRAMTARRRRGSDSSPPASSCGWKTSRRTLRTELGEAAAKTPTRRLPNFVVRMLLPFAANLRSLAPLLGRRFPLTSAKARQTLGFTPRPAAMTVVDCARSCIGAGA